MTSKKITVWYQESPGLDTKGKPSTVLRPLVDVQVNYKHGQMIRLTALVDSGSDYNLFPADICRVLGINLTKGTLIRIKGIGDAPPIEAYRHFGIKIFFESLTIETFADFSSAHNQTILGQKGFFDQFQGIELRRPEEKIIFTSK
ncbi:hypothetical protein HYU92_04100 [Candidatus Curtissbacteria bacterium]|nr:hypothetical protein [Candidatus Curtissbacteria bacterium]